MKISISDIEFQVIQLVLRDDSTNKMLLALADELKNRWKDEEYINAPEWRKSILDKQDEVAV